MRSKSLRDQLIVGFASAVVLSGALASSHPIYMAKTAIMQRLFARKAVDTTAVLAPWLTKSASEAIRTPQFLADRQAFADDLLRTGKVHTERAWELADVAVREAYKRRVPPALVLGVMLTENDELKSTARSSVGALGLMQINPRPWRGLGKLFGSNLRNDSTNLKYGIFILDFLAEKAGRDGGVESWRTALLRYNGCKTGSNTPDCHRYPDVVRRSVLRNARYSCEGKDFAACVTHPLWLANRAEGSNDRQISNGSTEPNAPPVRRLAAPAP
jgi:soluble lytic murein transglycosylase-like protein